LGESTEFVIGSRVACRDGDCGELRRVVIDPVARAITHLVVEPRHRRRGGRLVPIDRVASSTPEEIRLTLTLAQFEVLEEADEAQLLPGASGGWGYEQHEMHSLPYYVVAQSGMGAISGIDKDMSVGRGAHQPTSTHDHVPAGEVEIRRGDHVRATDGSIGRVGGLIVDPGDHHVTHVLLDEGHLWGAKRVGIPISAVTRIDDEVRVKLTKAEVRDLPPVDLDALE
jgi:sporulation protein YlmC with PRC-barrel domain